MWISIKTKNLTLSDSLEAYVKEKFSPLEKFVSVLNAAELFVELEKETKHHRKGEVFVAEALVHLPGKDLVSIAKSDDLFKAIVEAKDELKLEIEKYKNKKIDKTRRGQRKAQQEEIDQQL